MGGMTRIDFRTISGQADSPLAPFFHWRVGNSDAVAEAIPLLHKLRPAHPEQDESPVLRNRIDPGSKLAGNQLHNFAAFFDQSWRENDWLWGQADAATGLIDVLLDQERGRTLAPTQVEAIVKGTGIAPTPDTPWLMELNELGENLWEAVAGPVSAELHSAAAAPSSSAAEPIPLELTRAVILWRRQMEIFGDERITKPEAQSSLRDVLQEWDEQPRSLMEKWGDPFVSALGVRTASVAVREIARGSGWALKLVRWLLSPLVLLVASLGLGRHRAAAATLLFVGGVVLPRTHTSDLGRLAVAASAAAIAAAALWFFKDPQPKGESEVSFVKRALRHPWAIVVLLLGSAVIAGAYFIDKSPLEWALPPSTKGYAGSHVIVPASWTSHLLVPAVAAAVATCWYSVWARWFPRGLMTVWNGTLIAFWVGFAAQGERAPSEVQFLESLWWPVFVIIPILSTILLLGADVCRFPPSRESS